ncbi:MAG: methyltransferase [Chlorobi bacterium]|nr:methyltransferase [Chlorobiota bacterium]
MLPLNPKIEKYIEAFSSPEDPLLAELNRYTHQHTVNPQMITGHPQGMFLEIISRLIAPQQILEIGTFTGYGTICLSKGLLPGGRILTIEKNDEMAPTIRTSFKKAGISSFTQLMFGDALKLIPTLKRHFNLVFIDAEKAEYPEYYRLVINKLRPGGIILADNTLWNGKVAEPDAEKDPAARGISVFNKMAREDDRVSVVILPVRDGISLIRKK